MITYVWPPLTASAEGRGVWEVGLTVTNLPDIATEDDLRDTSDERTRDGIEGADEVERERDKWGNPFQQHHAWSRALQWGALLDEVPLHAT